jgi:hypothetical protein
LNFTGTNIPTNSLRRPSHNFNNITAIGGPGEQIVKETSNFLDSIDDNDFFMKLSSNPKNRRNSSDNIRFSLTGKDV